MLDASCINVCVMCVHLCVYLQVSISQIGDIPEG